MRKEPEVLPPYLILGLGNPGLTYSRSRHNAGFCVLDLFAELYPAEESRQGKNYSQTKHRINGQLFYLVKPLTYMNLSGSILSELRKKTGCGPDNIIVVCDNMDLPLGRLRLKYGGGSAGQKGLKNIIDNLGSSEFARVYVGIGRPAPPMSVPDYVLGRFPAEEENFFLEVCTKAAELVQKFAFKNWAELQALFNRL
jgi:PTH1 family peptidyl-tRNA hydrolase